MSRPPIHPGEILADELRELGMSADQLGREMQVPTEQITQVLSGHLAMSADMAVRLGTWLGTGPELWMYLQASYEHRIAE